MNPKVILSLLGKIGANLIKMMLTEKMLMRLSKMYVKMTKNKWDDKAWEVVEAARTSDEEKLVKSLEEFLVEVKASMSEKK